MRRREPDATVGAECRDGGEMPRLAVMDEIKLLDVVALTEALPAEGLRRREVEPWWQTGSRVYLRSNSVTTPGRPMRSPLFVPVN